MRKWTDLIKEQNKLSWLDHILHRKRSKDSNNREDKVTTSILIKLQNNWVFALLLQEFYRPYGYR